jgi:hypothetical protein
VKFAIENLRKSGRLESRVQESPGGIRIGLMADGQGQNPFTTSHVFLFEDYFGDYPNGVLFGLPQRRAILYHPIVDQGVVPSVDVMLGTLADMHREGPESLSPSLFWWKAGKVTPLPTSVEGKEIRFAPPPDFIQLVESLPPVKSPRRRSS